MRDQLLAAHEQKPCLWDPSRKDYLDFSAIAIAKQSIASKFEWATGMCILLLYISRILLTEQPYCHVIYRETQFLSVDTTYT